MRGFMIPTTTHTHSTTTPNPTARSQWVGPDAGASRPAPCHRPGRFRLVPRGVASCGRGSFTTSQHASPDAAAGFTC